MPAPGRFDRLDAIHVEATLERLRERIATAMPGRHLADVADEVRRVVVKIESGARHARRRAVIRVVSQVSIWFLVVLIVAGVVSAIHAGLGADEAVHGFEWLSVVKSGVNDVVFAAVAIWFLQSLPERVERRRRLGILYRLRSLAHVTDMHQASKHTAVKDSAVKDTAVKDPDGLPHPPMDSETLVRYLEFCSDLLTLTAKAAALCGENTTDAVVLDTVSEIETLTASMSRKIWQKISIIRMVPPQAAA
ncbi:MAG: hypothetical protein FWD11_04970 [Micrococcales bacterium]|nr:hypothetical protein [Micrococcales bacterium]